MRIPTLITSVLVATATTSCAIRHTGSGAEKNTVAVSTSKPAKLSEAEEGYRRAAAQLIRDTARSLAAAGVKAEQSTDSLGLPQLRILLADPQQTAEPNVTGYNAASQAAAEAVAATLAEGGPALYVYVEGHTDNVGPYQENMAVSLKRAQAVAGLIVRKGVPQERVSARGRSYDQPIADNHLMEGRAKNRRVEIFIRVGEQTRYDLGLM